MNLKEARRLLLMLGISFLALQYIIESLPHLFTHIPRERFAIGDVDLPGVLGAAFILLATTSWLNWKFKEAWEERSRSLTAPTTLEQSDEQ